MEALMARNEAASGTLSSKAHPFTPCAPAVHFRPFTGTQGLGGWAGSTVQHPDKPYTTM